MNSIEKSNDATTLGGRIKALREKAGMTQEELAKKLMITREHLSKLEAGTRKVQSADVPVLADVLGSTCDYILAGKETGNVRLSREIGLDNDVIEKLAELTIVSRMYDHDLPSDDDGILKSVLSHKAREKLDAINFVLSADMDFRLMKLIYAYVNTDFSSCRQGLYTKDDTGNLVHDKNRTDGPIYELLFFSQDKETTPITLPVSVMKFSVMESIKKLIETMGV